MGRRWVLRRIEARASMQPEEARGVDTTCSGWGRSSDTTQKRESAKEKQQKNLQARVQTEGMHGRRSARGVSDTWKRVSAKGKKYKWEETYGGRRESRCRLVT